MYWRFCVFQVFDDGPFVHDGTLLICLPTCSSTATATIVYALFETLTQYVTRRKAFFFLADQLRQHQPPYSVHTAAAPWADKICTWSKSRAALPINRCVYQTWPRIHVGLHNPKQQYDSSNNTFSSCARSSKTSATIKQKVGRCTCTQNEINMRTTTAKAGPATASTFACKSVQVASRYTSW